MRGRGRRAGSHVKAHLLEAPLEDPSDRPANLKRIKHVSKDGKVVRTAILSYIRSFKVILGNTRF